MFKKKIGGIIIILFLFFVSAVTVINKERDELKGFLLNNSMDFQQIQKAMMCYPPDFRFGKERSKIFQSMDALISFSVKHDNYRDTDNDRIRMEQIAGFYKNQIDKALDNLEKTEVNKGEIYVLKLYSSSIILKSSQGTVAIDFCQGPVGNLGEPEQNDFYNSGFYMTPEQRSKLAQLVDIQIITHQHHDHADFSLASRLRKMNKIVIATEQNKKYWENEINGIIVPDYDKIQDFGVVQILAQKGCQYENTKMQDGLLVGFPSGKPANDVESARYLIKIDEIIFLQSAESYTEAYVWLKKAQAIGWDVDVVLSRGLGQGERSVIEFLVENNETYFEIPIHEYELMHENGGNRTAQWLKDENLNMFEKKKIMPLLWGENFCLNKSFFK